MDTRGLGLGTLRGRIAGSRLGGRLGRSDRQRCACGAAYPAAQSAAHRARHERDNRRVAAHVPMVRPAETYGGTAGGARPAAYTRRAPGGTGVREVDAWLRATERLSALEPADAGEFDRILLALQRASALAGARFADLGEQWTAEHRIDRRITAHVGEAGDWLAGMGECFRDSRTALRTVYAAFLAAAESGVDLPGPDFFRNV